MTEEKYITYSEYSTICNRIVGWLTKNNKQFVKRNIYGYEDREADRETIEIVALDRYNKGVFGADGLVTEYFECAVVDNTDYSFMPNTVTNETGYKYNISEVIDMANRVSKYEVEHNGASPNIVYRQTDAPTTDCTNPYTQNVGLSTGCNGYGQCTAYYCGCNSLQMSFYKLTGVLVSESTIASWCSTTTSGTSHSGLETGVKRFNQKYGTNLKINWYNFSDLGWEGIGKKMCSKNDAVFMHLLYRNKYGHYEMPYKLNTSNGQMQIYNSLGSKNGSGYVGYIESRSTATERQYMQGISQKSVCVISK